MGQSLLYNLILLVSLHIHLGLCDVIYISPSPDDCKVQYKVCLTLKQLASDTVSIKDNTTLVFLPGNHTLMYDFTISDPIKLSMQVDSSLVQTKPTKGTKILCQRKAKFEFVNMKYLRVDGLHFIGCGNNGFYSIKQVLVHNSTFQGHNDSRTALEIIASNATSNVTITKSYFISNVVGRCSRIRINEYMLRGGAFLLTVVWCPAVYTSLKAFFEIIVQRWVVQ